MSTHSGIRKSIDVHRSSLSWTDGCCCHKIKAFSLCAQSVRTETTVYVWCKNTCVYQKTSWRVIPCRIDSRLHATREDQTSFRPSEKLYLRLFRSMSLNIRAYARISARPTHDQTKHSHSSRNLPECSSYRYTSCSHTSDRTCAASSPSEMCTRACRPRLSGTTSSASGYASRYPFAAQIKQLRSLISYEAREGKCAVYVTARQWQFSW